MVYIDANGKVTKCAKERGTKRSYEGFPVRVYGPSSFFRRELFADVGGFDTSLKYSMDTDLWCKFRQAGYWFEKLDRYLWGFRIHDDSLTSGDLIGKTPEGMKVEGRLIDERYGLSRSAAKVRRLQLTRILDGSYPKAFFDTLKYRGKNWKEVMR